MITYAERSCFLPSHIELLSRVEGLVARVSNTWGNELRCHELARAVQHVLKPEYTFIVVDGRCGPIEHSWLQTAGGVILDAYVPGRLPAVQIVDPLVGAAYRPGPDRQDIRQEIVDRLVSEMRSVA